MESRLIYSNIQRSDVKWLQIRIDYVIPLNSFECSKVLVGFGEEFSEKKTQFKDRPKLLSSKLNRKTKRSIERSNIKENGAEKVGNTNLVSTIWFEPIRIC